MQRAALYLRASSDHQRYSTANQDEALRRYAAQEGLEIVASYEDDGRSGLNLNGRPALRQLLQDVLNPGCQFGVILVLDVSRWGRFQDVDESAYYEFMCRRAGVRVIYCAEPYLDSNSPMVAVVKSIKRAMAAEFSRELSGKVWTGQRRLVNEGFSQGSLPSIGLRRLLIDADGVPKGRLAKGEYKSIATDRVILVPGPPKEVAAVIRMFELCAEQRLGPFAIAKLLNKERVPAAGRSAWNGAHVLRLLTNEKFVGTNVFGRTAAPLRTPRRPTAPSTWVRREKAFKAVVPQDLFMAAQGVLAERRRRVDRETMLVQLAALFAREGRLTGKLIDAEPKMATASSYTYWFGSLTCAARQVGYHHPRAYQGRPGVRGKKYNRDGLLELLRACLARHGRLSKAIIESDPSTPSSSTYNRAFGSLRDACAAVGYVMKFRRGVASLAQPSLGPDCGPVE